MRIERWEKVFQGMLDGAISFGTRTPIQEIPAWVTLEVAQGGFATGNLTAGGVLLPHELDLLSRLNRPADRSLLLLNLEHQVRLQDLPWIATLNSLRHDDLDTKEQARANLQQVATIAIVSFPHAILPNKLLQELRSLINAAGLSLPIVDELAVDIFTGAFSEKFLRAAQLAGRMLHGTLYERYFGLAYERVLQLESPAADGTHVSSRD
jgi:hypothetical protein